MDWFLHLYVDERFNCPEEVESAEFRENSAGSGIVISSYSNGNFEYTFLPRLFQVYVHELRLFYATDNMQWVNVRLQNEQLCSPILLK